MNRMSRFFRGAVLTAAAVTASTALLHGSAEAAVRTLPSIEGPGFSHSASGQWESYQEMRNITLRLCDASPADKNKASVVLQAYVIRNGIATILTAPTTFVVPQSDAHCKVGRDAFLAYIRPGDQLDKVRAVVGFSGHPEQSWATAWAWRTSGRCGWASAFSRGGLPGGNRGSTRL